MNQERKKIIESVQKILSTKYFPHEEKQMLLNIFLYIYDHYDPPKYAKISKLDYIEEYLKILESMKGFTIFHLEDLNLPIDAIEAFRDDIKEAQNHDGNLELIDGKYVPALNGSYYCSCKGLAWRKEKFMFVLDEGYVVDKLMAGYHEMTHLGEGEIPFPIKSNLPLCFEFRKMCYEGHAATRESYLDVSNGELQISSIKEGSQEIAILSKFSYPLYSTLYQFLQFIFGIDILEKFCQNNDGEVDMLDTLKEEYPDLPVEEIYAHCIYLLSRENEYDGLSLERAINFYQQRRFELLRHANEQYQQMKELENIQKERMKECKMKERDLKEQLQNPKKLEHEYLIQLHSILKKEKDAYEQGRITEVEYQTFLKEIKERTIEEYRTIQENCFVQIQKEIQSLKIQLVMLQNSLQTLSLTRKELKQNSFPKILRSVCLEKASISSSFEFLYQIALRSIKRKYPVTSGNPQTQVLFYSEMRKILFLYMNIKVKKSEKFIN